MFIPVPVNNLTYHIVRKVFEGPAVRMLIVFVHLVLNPFLSPTGRKDTADAVELKTALEHVFHRQPGFIPEKNMKLTARKTCLD